ncbi:peptide ABC transporter permease [Tistrella bauzanensis]|uniref:Peptide ABC transporter permease n=1 Tax=Tistrella bauzanensis TaxID=657419 RepID=A0ABQ1IM36_9PROT|nr:ABC transporter permease [Tistrella bauzanensis]GGB42971.1 peptide ABC transporter permease [Tistrella bauzanensis]
MRAGPPVAGRSSIKAAAGLVVGLAVTLLGLVVVTFLIGRVVPIDPALVVAGDRAGPAAYQAARVALGLDLPLYEQLLLYLWNVLNGDLGRSTMTGLTVAEDVARVFPATVELAMAGTIIGVGFGVPMGVIAAARAGRLADHLVRAVALVGYSVPVFWLGLVGLLVFYARLGWVAGPGRLDVVWAYTIPEVTGFVLIDTLLAGEPAAMLDGFRHLILPAAILGYFSMAYVARMTRSLMIEQLGQDYILAARAKGAPEALILWGHAFRNILVPLVTVVALTFAHLLEGAVLTETVFAWPGIGLYITQALFAADMNAVLGGTLVVGVAFVLMNRAADLVHRRLDARLRSEAAR